MTEYNYNSLKTAGNAKGLVVVIDVLRAFTTAAHAFNVGVERILPVAGVEEAVQLKSKVPGSLIMGEVDGEKPKHFDFGNSPAEISCFNLLGKTLIQRTSAGTQGIVRAINADYLYAASFVVAKATAQAIHRYNPAVVSFVITGESSGRDGEEDRACAEYIQSMVNHQSVDHKPFIERVASSTVGRSVLGGRNQTISKKDYFMSIEVNRFNFALPVWRENATWVMTTDWMW